jgi:uncharacterized membrane protein
MSQASFPRPLHRRFTPLPTAVLLVVTIADLTAALTGWSAGWRIGWTLAVPALALAALDAVLGAIDALRVRRARPGLPPRMLRHVALAAPALLLYLLAWFLRAHPEIPLDPPLLAAELIGAGLLLLSHGSARRARRHTLAA